MEPFFLVLSQPGGQQGAAGQSWKLSHDPRLVEHPVMRIFQHFSLKIDPSEGFPPKSQLSQSSFCAFGMQNNAEYFHSFSLNP